MIAKNAYKCPQFVNDGITTLNMQCIKGHIIILNARTSVSRESVTVNWTNHSWFCETRELIGAKQPRRYKENRDRKTMEYRRRLQIK